MALNIRQREFLNDLGEQCAVLSRTVRDIGRLAEQYNDEFAVSKTNEIQAADLVEYGITQNKLDQFALSVAQLNNFWNNTAVATRDNKKFFQNVMRGL